MHVSQAPRNDHNQRSERQGNREFNDRRKPISLYPLFPHGASERTLQHRYGNSTRTCVRLCRYSFLACLVFIHTAVTYAADKKAPPAKPATQYTLYETHEREHVTVAADPCDKVEACPFFRNPYVRHGFLPVRVIITNDSDIPLDLNDVRIQFISENRDIIPAALDEDLNRRLYSKKAAQGRSMPLPFPGARIPISSGAQVDKKITEDDRDFGFPGTTVAPHSTLAGYLFYDIKDLDDPAMHHATLYLKEIKFAGTPPKDAKAQLFDFNLPFDKWLAAQPKPAAKTPDKKPD